MRLIIPFLFLSVISCKETNQNPLTKVTLLQPDIKASRCYSYRYENGHWKPHSEYPIESCDLIFGVTWRDYEKLVNEFNRSCGVSRE